MAGISERNKQQNQLANIGYSLRYIDEWQPKTILYRHKPDYNIDGDIVQDVGTPVKNVPGNPDYVMKKSKIGQFGWPPSDTCECKWCVERATKEPVAIGVGSSEPAPEAIVSEAIVKERPYFTKGRRPVSGSPS